MKKISSLPKPDGFFDPTNPGGTPIPPERDPNLPPSRRPIRTRRPPSRRPTCSASPTRIWRSRATMCSWAASTASTPTTSSAPTKPKLARRVGLPGRTGRHFDPRQPAVHVGGADARPPRLRHAGRVDRRSAPSVSAACASSTSPTCNKPKQVAAVQTCRGSHTHTLVTDPKDKANLYVYGSGTSGVRSGEELAGLLRRSDPTRTIPTPSLFSIDVIQVPLATPQQARRSSTIRASSPIRDRQHRRPANKGGDQRPRHADDERRPTSATTSRCSRRSASPPARARATASCSTSAIRSNPKRLDVASDKNFAYWHSATFNNDGTKVIFTDEWGGGTRPRCRAIDLLNWGADAIFDIVDQQAGVRGLLQDAGAADRAGKLRGAQRLADPGARARHHGAGVVSGRRVGVRLHRFGAPEGDRVLRPRTDRRQER